MAKVKIPEAIELAKMLLKVAGEERVVLGPQLAEALGAEFDPERFRTSDVIVAIGGDGTVLRANRLASGVPVIGVNVGERGFLAEARPDELEVIVDKLLKGRFDVFETIKLASETEKGRLPDAVNDVVVVPARIGKTVSLEVSVDGKLAFRFRGDGVVASTPIGSTGYARSAGGPILDPRSKVFALVPLCPSDLQIPKLVVPEAASVEIRVVRPGENGAVVVDGHQEAELQIGKSVKVWKAETGARFVVWADFYRKLAEKLL